MRGKPEVQKRRIEERDGERDRGKVGNRDREDRRTDGIREVRKTEENRLRDRDRKIEGEIKS
jgi:hypothetical protein